MHQIVDNNSIFGLKDAQRILNLGYHTVQNLLTTGQLPAKKVGNEWKISGRNLLNWIKEHQNNESAERQFEPVNPALLSSAHDMLRDWT